MLSIHHFGVVNGQTSLMFYKYTWTPSFKGTHSLITDLTLGEL